ncbi:MAG: hypothetical protein HQ538_00915 [Parcubacteria group bacterium]|nr:hypothetical protein [Parcubacteria group bacterium]
MDKYGLDVIVASAKGYVAYTSGYRPVGFFRPEDHQTFYILPRDEEKFQAIIIL